MPLYEYACERCKYIVEKIFPIDRVPKTVICRNCDDGICYKKISPCNFQLKGSGWSRDNYVTDSERAEAIDKKTKE